MHLQPTKRDQSGFSVIEMSIVAVVVAILVATGWLVYQHHKPINTKNSAATSQTQTTTQPTTHYLTIKEWGIKLPLSDSIKDAYYIPGISSKGTDGLPNQLWIGFKSLDGNGCTATSNSGPALIFRALPTNTDPVSGQLLTQKYPNGATVGSYYYGYEDFTTSSSNTCKASQITLQTVHAALTNAVKGIVAAQTTTQYLTIKEWGVRAPYSGSLKLSDTMSSDRRTATFSSEQLTALSSACTGRGGFIIRWASTDQVSEGPPDANTPTAEQAFADKDPSTVPYAHIGNYYYTFAHDQAACGDLTTTAALQSQTNDAVKALVPNLQAVPN